MPHSHEPTSVKRVGHALLRQQIDECLGDGFTWTKSLDEFLRTVDGTYHDFEQKLRASAAISLEAQCAAAPVGAHEGLLRLDPHGRVSDCNAAAATLLRIPATTLVGAKLQELGLELVDREGTPIPPDEWPTSKAFKTGRPQSLPLIGMHGASSNRSWISMSVSPLRSDSGELVGAACRLADKTHQKRAENALQESEERFRLAFESSGIGMALLTMEGKWVRVNRALCQMLGYTEEELRETDFQSLTHPDDLPKNERTAERLRKREIDVMQVEKRYRHRSGRYLWTRLTCSIAFLPNGKPLHYISQIEDISKSRELEHALQATRDEAVSASKLKDTYLATVSQGIRAPIDGILKLVAERETPPSPDAHLAMRRAIRGHVQTLLGVIESLGDFSDIEAPLPALPSDSKPPRLLVAEDNSTGRKVAQAVFDRTHLDRMAQIAAPHGSALASAAITLFLDETPRSLEELDELKKQRQRQALSLAADSLAKSAASLGAAPFQDALRQLSAVAQKGEWEAVDLISFPQLLESWGQLRDALARYNPPAQ